MKISYANMRCNKKGFSLAEVMVTMLIFSIVMGGVYTILLMGENSWNSNSVKIRLQQESRKAFEWMEYDLRQAGSSSIVDVDANGELYTSITFRIPAGVSGGTIVWETDTIQFLRGGPEGDQLIRVKGSDSRIIAQNVSSLSFSRSNLAPSILDIVLTVSDETARGDIIEINNNYKIQLRNH